MKAIKLLAALAMPLFFVACSNEENLVDAPMQEQEIVGAELIGTDISMKFDFPGVESRYANGNWEMTDYLGLGWVVTDGYEKQQKETLDPDKTTLFANHMFMIPEEGADFSTKGNVYKGWHFAYFPYERMDAIGEKVIDINPIQDCLHQGNNGGARYHKRFAISPRHFLTVDDLDPNTNELVSEKKFAVQWATNEIVMNLTPSSEFTSSKYLNNLAVKSVDLSTTKAVLTDFVKLDPTAIPEPVDEDGESIYVKNAGEYDEAKTKEVLLAAIPNILKSYTNNKYTNVGYVSKMTTEVTAPITTAETGVVRFFTLPNTDNQITPTITVKVEGGVFTVKKVSNAEEGSYAALNNAELDKLIEAYQTNGVMTKIAGSVNEDGTVNAGGLRLQLNLYPAIFKPDFTDIKSYKEWQQCVNIVNALGYTADQTFTITDDIEVTGTTISLPKKCKVKVAVKGDAEFIIKKTLKSWPADEKLDLENVDVVFDADNTIAQQIDAASITNNATMTMAEGTSEEANELSGDIINNGTIIVNKYAEVSTVDNTNGRIEIIYGGVANTVSGAEGVIFYTLNGTETAARYNNLISYGNVNTFVVNNGMEFDFNVVDKGSAGTDEYVSTPGTEVTIIPANLAGITIEMNGGSVIGKLDDDYEIFALEVLSGTTNTTTDLLTQSINVAGGTLVIDATTPEDADKNELDLDATTVAVAADATLTANANTHVYSLANEGTVKANSGYSFHYTTGTNSGTLTGDVEVCDCPVVIPEVEDVMEVWDDYSTALGSSVTTYEGLVDQIKLHGGDSNKKAYTFFNALKAWYVAYYALAAPVDNTTVTKAHLTEFEAKTGESFGLN